MPTLINTDNEEVVENISINNMLMVIEITGYSFEYIDNLSITKYKELERYCCNRVHERRAMAKALGVNVKDMI